MLEYVKHLLIRTPLEIPARQFQLFRTKRRLWHVPELRDLSIEPMMMDRALRRALSDSSNCIDVGSHLGSMLSCFLRQAGSGHHIAFEPTPQKARWLRRKFPEVDVYELALSDRSGDCTLFISNSHTGCNSIRRSSQVKTITVKCARLDDVLPENYRVDLIKLDVEGGELAVLRGGIGKLNRYRPMLLFESTRSNLTAFGLTTAEVFQFLSNCGYLILLIKDFLENGEALNFERFDNAHEYPFKAFNFIAVHR